jgi:hypothetical protein
MYEYDFYTRYNENRTPSTNNLILPSSSKFSFKDDNGNYFDDSKIKELGLGCVVAYRNLVETGDDVLEFGLGNSPNANQFSLYSVDTTNGYAVNSSNYINISSDSDLSKFGDNSVQSLSTNNTIYLSQNSTNTYSETANKVDISPSNAMVIEYESSQPIMPSKMEIFQQASHPDPNAPTSTEVSTPLAGANGTESFTLTGSDTNPSYGPLANLHDNVIDGVNYIPQSIILKKNTNGYANWFLNYQFSNAQVINKYRMWSTRFNTNNQVPKNWELLGSNDGTTFTSLHTVNGATWTGYTQTLVASNNLNIANEYSFTNTTPYTIYRFQITQNNGNIDSCTLAEVALYGDKTRKICVAGAETNNVLGNFTAYGLYGNNATDVIPASNFNSVGHFYSSSTMVDKIYSNYFGGDEMFIRNDGNYPLAVAYDFTTAQVVNKYRLWSRGTAIRALKSWELRGADKATYDSQNPNTYTTLDTQTNYTLKNTDTTNRLASNNLADADTFTFTNETAFTYYVLHITQNGGEGAGGTTGYTSVSELALYKDDTYAPVAAFGVSTGFTAEASSSLGALQGPDKLFDNTSNSYWASGVGTFSGGSRVGYTFCGCVFDTPQIITKYNVYPMWLAGGVDGNPKRWDFVGADSLTDLQNDQNLTVIQSVNLTGTVNYSGALVDFPGISILQSSNSQASDLQQYGNNYEVLNSTAFKAYGLIIKTNYGKNLANFSQFGLYTDASTITTSRMPKEIIFQGQKLNDNVWTTIEQNVLTTEPNAAGFVAPSTLPQNPNLANLTAPYDETFNQSNQHYKKMRLVIPQAYTDNSINIGEWVLRKKNHIKTYLGNNDSSFNQELLTYEVVSTTRDSDNNYPLDDTPGVSVNINPATTKDELQDGNTHTYTQLSMNTDNTYSTTANLINFGDRYMKITYDFPEPSVINNFLCWSNNNNALLSKLMKNIEIQGYYSINRVVHYDILYDGDLSTTIPIATTSTSIDSETAYNPKETLGFNTTNKKYDAIIIIVKSNFDQLSNNIVLADLLFSGYDTGTNFYKQVPFIGMVCTNQITSGDKYKIPLPIEGEFNSLSRSFQNNEFSLINSWERKITNDDRGVVVAQINFTTVGRYENVVGANVMTIGISQAQTGDPLTSASFTPIIDLTSIDEVQLVTGIEITNNGSHYKSAPQLIFLVNGVEKPPTDVQWTTYPVWEVIMGDFKTSYNKGVLVNNEPNFPYITIGSNDMNCEFDTTQSRMNFNKMHTLMKQGQEANGLSRYYDNSMVFNSSLPLISPDTESGNDVMKIHNTKFYLNSTRSGFTESISKSNLADQIIPITNPFLKQKGIASSISGIGIMGLHVGKKDGTYNKVSQFNKHSYTNCLFDKLGFKIEQLLPIFGNQNNMFNRGSHNRYIDDNKLAVSKLNNMVKPVTTNGFISASLNQSLNTSNLNFLFGNLDGNNQLQKSVAQVSDSLIGINLPQKFSYSHLLVYSNIVNKYNYIGGQIINDIPCVGSVNRSYETGDFIFGNSPGVEYTIDKTKILTDVDVDIRTNLGTPALLGEGSTITFKIDKFRDLPLALQEKK